MNEAWDLADERALLAAAGVADFEFFARTVIGLTHPKNERGRWWDDAIHKPLCAWFQEQAEDWLAHRHDKTASRRYLAVLVPRGCGKSILLTRIGMLWLHLHDVNLSTYIGNETLDLATDFLRSIKGWLAGARDEHCIFNWLYGGWKGDSQRWRTEDITHAARTIERGDPSFGIWSPKSSLTGRHPDILCMDDLVSYDALEKDIDWFNTAYAHMTDLIPVVEPNGLVLLIGTRYGDDDPFGRCFKSDGIRSLVGHTEFIDDYKPRANGRWNVYFLSAKDKQGNPTIPTVWPQSELDLLELRDPIKLACQALNRPHAHQMRALTEEQFDSQVVKEAPKKCYITFHMDTAFKSIKRQQQGSETALIAVAHDLDTPGRVVVVDCFRTPVTRSELFATEVINWWRRWKDVGEVIAMTDEQEMAGKIGVWEQYLRDRFLDEGVEPEDFPAFFTYARQTGEKKEIRISNAIAFIRAKQVFFLESAGALLDLRSQLCNHPRSHPNDLNDAFADYCQPEFYMGLLPKLKDEAEKKRDMMTGSERRTKPRWFENSDTLDDDMLDRPPIRRGALPTGASPARYPYAEGMSAPATYRSSW